MFRTSFKRAIVADRYQVFEFLFMPPRTITQEHPMGCGVACVAFILKLSYQKTLKLFGTPSYAWGRGFYCRELVAVLNAQGQSYHFRKFKEDYSPLLKKPGTMVFIRKNTRYPFGHFLCRTQRGWMNPWSNCPIITPAESRMESRLPGEVSYIIFETSKAPNLK
jgi:hypothetical protein